MKTVLQESIQHQTLSLNLHYREIPQSLVIATCVTSCMNAVLTLAWQLVFDLPDLYQQQAASMLTLGRRHTEQQRGRVRNFGSDPFSPHNQRSEV